MIEGVQEGMVASAQATRAIRARKQRADRGRDEEAQECALASLRRDPAPAMAEWQNGTYDPLTKLTVTLMKDYLAERGGHGHRSCLCRTRRPALPP